MHKLESKLTLNIEHNSFKVQNNENVFTTIHVSAAKIPKFDFNCHKILNSDIMF